MIRGLIQAVLASVKRPVQSMEIVHQLAIPALICFFDLADR